MGRGRGDVGTGTGTPGCVFGTRDSETRGLGRGDACKRGGGTRGRGDGDAGTRGWDAGLGDARPGTWGHV